MMVIVKDDEYAVHELRVNNKLKEGKTGITISKYLYSERGLSYYEAAMLAIKTKQEMFKLGNVGRTIYRPIVNLTQNNNYSIEYDETNECWIFRKGDK